MNERLQESEVTKKNKDPITVTDRALDRVRYLLDLENNAQIIRALDRIRYLLDQKNNAQIIRALDRIRYLLDQKNNAQIIRALNRVKYLLNQKNNAQIIRILDRVRYLLDQKNNAQARDEGYEPDDQEDEGYESDDQEDEFENDSWKIKKAIGVRVLIKQKGCSGLKYDIEYAYDIRPLESVIEKSCSDGQKIKVLIDPKSVMFILGSEMDYIEEKLSSGFVFKNPNEKGKCGCGESFHV